MCFRIYLVEDDNNLNTILNAYLQKEGWQVTSFFNGESARKNIDNIPHLWILDIMLPDIDGFQLIKEIKNVSPDVPVIFISARDAGIDRVVGLDMGSDDYLTKPFLPRELVIRAGKLLDRIYKETSRQCMTLHNTENLYNIDITNRRVTAGTEIIDLTSKEFDLLLLFMKNQRQALSRDQILNHVWGGGYFGTDRVVDDLVRRLRKKMPDLRLETIYGYGYRMGVL